MKRILHTLLCLCVLMAAGVPVAVAVTTTGKVSAAWNFNGTDYTSTISYTIEEISDNKATVTIEVATDNGYVQQDPVFFKVLNGNAQVAYETFGGNSNSRTLTTSYAFDRAIGYSIEFSFARPGGTTTFPRFNYIYGLGSVPAFTFVPDTENVTTTDNSISIPYSITSDDEDFDAEGWTFEAWVTGQPQFEAVHATGNPGTIVQTGLTSDTDYGLWGHGKAVYNGAEFSVTNNDQNFGTWRTAINDNDVYFNVAYTNWRATASTIEVDYEFVATVADADLTGYSFRIWLDVEGVSNKEEYVSGRTGHLTIEGLDPGKAYRLWEKSYVTPPSGSERHSRSWETVSTFSTLENTAVNASVSDITMNSARLAYTITAPDGATATSLKIEKTQGGNMDPVADIEAPAEGVVGLAGLTPDTDYILTLTAAFSDATTADRAVSFKTLADTRQKPSTAYVGDHTFRVADSNPTSSAILDCIVSLTNPDGVDVDYITVAAAGDPNEAVNGVEYERWPTNNDIIWGAIEITNPVNGNNKVSISLKNLPENRATNCWMKTMVVLKDGRSYESGYAGAWPVNPAELEATRDLAVSLELMNSSNRSIMVKMPEVARPAGVSADFTVHRVFYYRQKGEDAGANRVLREFDKESALHHFFDYTELIPSTDYILGVTATAEVAGKYYSSTVEIDATTTSEPVNTWMFVSNGFFHNKNAGMQGNGVHPASVMNTVTKLDDKYYVTHDTDRRGFTPLAPVNKLRVKYYVDGIEKVEHIDAEPAYKYFDHYTFEVNISDIDKIDKISFTPNTDYQDGGHSHFTDIDFEIGAPNTTVYYGEPVGIEWLQFEAEITGKNQTNLTTEEPKTTLHAVVVDDNGNYLIDREVIFEYSDEATRAKHEGASAVLDHQTNVEGNLHDIWSLDLSAYTNDKANDIKIDAVHNDISQSVASRAGGQLRATKIFAYNDNPTTSIGLIGAEADESPVSYYGLDGVRIENPASGTVVIRVAGGKATKMVF